MASGRLVHFSRHSFESGENCGQPPTPSVSMTALCGEAKVYQIASIVEVGINSAVAWRNKGMDAGCFLHGRLSYNVGKQLPGPVWLNTPPLSPPSLPLLSPLSLSLCLCVCRSSCLSVCLSLCAYFVSV